VGWASLATWHAVGRQIWWGGQCQRCGMRNEWQMSIRQPFGVVGDMAHGGETDLRGWASLATWHAGGDVDLARWVSLAMWHVEVMGFIDSTAVWASLSRWHVVGVLIWRYGCYW